MTTVKKSRDELLKENAALKAEVETLKNRVENQAIDIDQIRYERGKSPVMGWIDQVRNVDKDFLGSPAYEKMRAKGWAPITPREVTIESVVNDIDKLTEIAQNNTCSFMVSFERAMEACGWVKKCSLGGVTAKVLDQIEEDVWFTNRMNEKRWYRIEMHGIDDFILAHLPTCGPYSSAFLDEMRGKGWSWAGVRGTSAGETDTLRWLRELDEGTRVSESFYRDMMQAGWIQKTPEAIHRYIMRLMPAESLKELHRKGIGHRVHVKMEVSALGNNIEFKMG